MLLCKAFYSQNKDPRGLADKVNNWIIEASRTRPSLNVVDIQFVSQDVGAFAAFVFYRYGELVELENVPA